MTTHTDFTTALDNFLDALSKRNNAEFARRFPSLDPTKYYAMDSGIKYVRIVAESVGSRSVFCFVRKSDGAILFARGWKAPDTKHVRGNIFADDNGLSGTSFYGANALR